MIVERITSLADLVFKVNKDKHYKQLLLLAYCYSTGSLCLPSRRRKGYESFSHTWRSRQGVPVKDDEFQTALNYYYGQAKRYRESGCSPVCEDINRFVEYVEKEPEPKPEPVVAAEPKPASAEKIEGEKIIAELKKKEIKEDEVNSYQMWSELFESLEPRNSYGDYRESYDDYAREVRRNAMRTYQSRTFNRDYYNNFTIVMTDGDLSNPLSD